VPPTFERTSRFDKDMESLEPQDRGRFKEKVLDLLVPALKEHQDLPAGLRVKGVQGAPGVFEMTFAPDGRATFQYGDPLVEGEAHIIWRRIGTHGVFDQP
jgi:mRNA-degrading endonuclease YafQ of YafQ-DinJ toxin-antitoxin module